MLNALVLFTAVSSCKKASSQLATTESMWTNDEAFPACTKYAMEIHVVGEEHENEGKDISLLCFVLFQA